MATGIQSPSDGAAKRHPFLLFAAVVFLVLAAVFYKSFEPNEILFANDGPLGAMKAENSSYPSAFMGHWVDTHWLGIEVPSAAPSLTGFICAVLPAELFLKVFAPLSLAFVGFSVWLLFRQLRFGSMVCLIGGLAGALNMNLFSVACWGLGTWNMAVGCTFLAIAALVSPNIRQAWAKAVLAGLAIGMSVMEGFDIGAILSIFAGSFVLFVVWNGECAMPRKVLKTIWMPALVVALAFLIAAHTFSTLVGTQIKGITNAQDDGNNKAAKWAFATGGSVPPMELLRIIIPGIFGYHMDVYTDSPDKSSAYWGRINESVWYPPIPNDNPVIYRQLTANPKTIFDLIQSEDPEYRRVGAKVAAQIFHLDAANESGLEQALAGNDPSRRYQAAQFVTANLTRAGFGLRHSASGKYAGVLVAVMAIFGIANSFRKTGTGPLTPSERRFAWFWAGVAVITVLLALGRHGFLYGWFFEIPYTSTIRNPEKFLFPFHVAWLILAGMGMEALRREFMEPKGAADLLTRRQPGSSVGFDKKWRWGSAIALALVLGIVFLVLPSKSTLTQQIAAHAFSDQAAASMVDFIYVELVWFIFFLVCSLALILWIINGAFVGSRVRWAWVLMGTILVVDLVRSDLPWIKYFDVTERYAADAFVKFLQDKPYEHRVGGKPHPIDDNSGISADQHAFVVYFFQLQNQFPYLNIQSVDVAQMPRKPQLDDQFNKTFTSAEQQGNYGALVRFWQLTNTRYILGSEENPFGIKFTPENGFVQRLSLGVLPTPGYSAVTRGEEGYFVETNKGTVAVYEFTNALPRAKLYSNWQVSSNEQAILGQLVSPQFDPQQSVIVSSETPVPTGPTEPNADPGTVKITSYKSKRVELQASAKTAAVMLLNDHIADPWNVYVDGKKAEVLRCNFIMRGVYLPKGEHTVEFRFQPKLTTLYISLSAWAVGILVAGFLFASNKKTRTEKPAA